MRRALLAVALPVLAVFAVPAQAATCAGADTMPTSANVDQTRTATLCLLNKQRRAHRLAPLRSNTKLQSAASRYSRQMVQLHFFDHVAPDGSTFDKRIEAAGYGSFTALAENIAWGSGSRATPAQIVDGWMHSAGHRSNILDGDLRDIGVGIASGIPTDLGLSGATYTTDFGRRH